MAAISNWTGHTCSFLIGTDSIQRCQICGYEKPILTKSDNDNIISNFCEHKFKYSHIEYPFAGTYSNISLNKEVVVCEKCGMIIKTDLV